MDRTKWLIARAALAQSYKDRIEALDEYVKDTRKISLFAQNAADRARELVVRLEAEEVRP
jgi:hypothetical protein